MPLTPKQQRFAEEYVLDLNATQAYKRAGYKVKTDHAAQVASSRLLLNVVVQERVRELITKRSAVAEITADDIWREWGHLARSDIGDILDFSGAEPRLKPVNEIPESARRAIASVKVKRCVEGHGEEAKEVELIEFKFWDKPGTLATVAKAMGKLVERVEHTGPDGGAIPHEVRVGVYLPSNGRDKENADNRPEAGEARADVPGR